MTIIVDIEAAHEKYQEAHGPTTKTAFLEILGMSWQTAANYQNGDANFKNLKYVQRIMDLTGLTFGEVVKKLPK